ncbi:MAG: glycosyl hydrolase family 28-related protein [Thermomicrobiales bacterium]
MLAASGIDRVAAAAGGVTNDVTHFGATGDGQTDDTAAIQAAIDAVPASGGAVLFPPGTYIVAPTRTSGIAIKGNLRLAGAGDQSIIKIADHNGDWGHLFAPGTPGGALDNLIVEDLAFDSNIANNAESIILEHDEQTYQTFLYTAAGRNIRVRRCRFDPYSGVWAVSLNGEEVGDCAVTDCSFHFVMRDGNPDYDNSGLYIEGMNYVLSGNRFKTTPNPYREARACMEGHGGPAKIFNNSAVGYQTLINIVGSHFEGNSSSDIVCHDNVIKDGLIGIMLWPVKPGTLKNVTVTNTTIEIAQLKHGTADTGGVSVVFTPEAEAHAATITITENTIRFQDEGAGRPGDFYYNSGGILLHNLGGTSGVVIEDNTIERSPSAGVLIGLPEPGDRLFDNVRVANNTIVNPGQNLAFLEIFRAGVLVNSSASNITITGNTITDTYAPPRCVAGVAFDLTNGSAYTGITVTGNTANTKKGPLADMLPHNAQ